MIIYGYAMTRPDVFCLSSRSYAFFIIRSLLDGFVLEKAIEDYFAGDKRRFISSKLERLVNTMEMNFSSNSGARAIIFVNERHMAPALAHMLMYLGVPGLKCGFAMGSDRGSHASLDTVFHKVFLHNCCDSCLLLNIFLPASGTSEPLFNYKSFVLS